MPIIIYNSFHILRMCMCAAGAAVISVSSFYTWALMMNSIKAHVAQLHFQTYFFITFFFFSLKYSHAFSVKLLQGCLNADDATARLDLIILRKYGYKFDFCLGCRCAVCYITSPVFTASPGQLVNPCLGLRNKVNNSKLRVKFTSESKKIVLTQ